MFLFILPITLLFNLNISATELSATVNKGYASNENIAPITPYKNIFSFSLGGNKVFYFNYTLDENNRGSFGIEGHFADYGYVWNDNYEIELINLTENTRWKVQLVKGMPVFYTAQNFVDQLNRLVTIPGYRVKFKSDNKNNMIVNGNYLSAGSTEFTVGYNELFKEKYYSTFSLKSKDRSSEFYLDFNFTASITPSNIIEFYGEQVLTDQYILSDEYNIKKIDSNGKILSDITVAQGTSVKDSLQKIVDNLNLNRSTQTMELMIQSVNNKDSIKVNNKPINDYAAYYTFNNTELTKNKFLNKIDFKISNEYGEQNFENCMTQGSLGHPIFGVYGPYDDFGLKWIATYTITIKSKSGQIKGKVTLNEGEEVIKQTHKFTNALNDKLVAVGDSIIFETSKPNTITINGKVMTGKSNQYIFTENGIKDYVIK